MNKKQLISLGIVVIVLIAGFSILMLHSNRASGGSAASSMNATATNHVEIKNYMFSPMTASVRVGTTVTWTNQDAVKHTITADTQSADMPDSMDIAQGQSYSFKFTKAGTYTYHCFPHPYMHGTIIVTE